MIRIVIVLLILAFLLGGCGLTPTEREAVEQTRQAGALVEAEATAPPEIRQAGADVRKNMETIQTEHGKPDVPVTYSPGASEDTRRRLATEYAAPPAAVGWIGGLADKWIPGVGAIAAGLWGLWKTMQAKREAIALGATLHGVEGVLAGLDPTKRAEAEKALAGAHAVAGVKTHIRRRLVQAGFAKPA